MHVPSMEDFPTYTNHFTMLYNTILWINQKVSVDDTIELCISYIASAAPLVLSKCN